MIAAGPLMAEHQLIKRMIALMDKEVQRIGQGMAPDTEFIRIVIDFIRTYADKLHHGKEEDILFRDLAKKPMSEEHKRIMEELIKDHVLGRGNTQKVADALKAYLAGDKGAARVMAENMGILVKFYPVHIEKEDKHFFIPVMDYLTREEQDAMLAEFSEFDRKYVHVHYKRIVSEREGK